MEHTTLLLYTIEERPKHCDKVYDSSTDDDGIRSSNSKQNLLSPPPAPAENPTRPPKMLLPEISASRSHIHMYTRGLNFWGWVVGRAAGAVQADVFAAAIAAAILMLLLLTRATVPELSATGWGW